MGLVYCWFLAVCCGLRVTFLLGLAARLFSGASFVALREGSVFALFSQNDTSQQQCCFSRLLFDRGPAMCNNFEPEDVRHDVAWC